MSISRWMDKEVVVHIHHGILLSYKNEHICVSSDEVDETGASNTEWVSQKEKHQYSIITHTCGIWNGGNRDTIYTAARRHRCKEQTVESCGRRWGWDDTRQWHWNMYITICKTADQCNFNAWSRPLLWDNPEGWGGEGGGKGFTIGVVRMCVCGCSMLMSGRGHHSDVKRLSSN